MHTYSLAAFRAWRRPTARQTNSNEEHRRQSWRVRTRMTWTAPPAWVEPILAGTERARRPAIAPTTTAEADRVHTQVAVRVKGAHWRPRLGNPLATATKRPMQDWLRLQWRRPWSKCQCRVFCLLARQWQSFPRANAEIDGTMTMAETARTGAAAMTATMIATASKAATLQASAREQRDGVRQTKDDESKRH